MSGRPHDRLGLWLILTWVPLVVVVGALVAGWSPVWGVVVAGVMGAAVTIWVWVTLRGRGRSLSEGVTQGVGGVLESLLITGHRPVTSEEELARSLADIRGAVNARSEGAEITLSNLTGVLDAAPWPMVATDAKGVVVLKNRGADAFFARPGGVLGRSVEELFTHAEVLGLHAAAVGGRSREGQVRLQFPDGARIYQVFAAPMSLRDAAAGARPGVVLSLRDITELAVAVQLKTDFVANASHELRTPLSSIRAAVETLSDGAWDDEPMRGRLTQMIASNVQRLEDMVRDLLDLSRLESPEAPVVVGPVRLAELAAGLEEEMQPFAAQRSLVLRFDIDAGVEVVRTDAKLLHLVLKNLIDNATKFANEGSQVRITAQMTPPPGEGAMAGVRFQVIDRGTGIPISQQQRVFERFFQVDPARTGYQHRRGTGLGLAIVKHAVKALGGTITVTSIWKEGTTMTVDLPGAVGADEPA